MGRMAPALLMVCTILLVLRPNDADGARILVASKPGGKSHHINMIEVMKALKARGEDHRFMVMAPEGEEEFWRSRLPDDVEFTVEVPAVTEEEIQEIIARLESQGPVQQLVETVRVMATLDFCPDRTMEEAGEAIRVRAQSSRAFSPAPYSPGGRVRCCAAT